MKRAIYFLALFALVFSSCDPMKDINDEIDVKNSDYKNDVAYTLTTSDYTALAKLIKGNKTDSAFIATRMYFNDAIPAADYIPAYLSKLYPALSEGSSAMITYNYNGSLPDDLSSYTAVTEYNVADNEYQSSDNALQVTKYYSPSYSPEVYIPKVLASGVTTPANGDMRLVKYKYSDVDPLLDYNHAADDTVWKETFNGGLGTFTPYSILGIQGWTTASYGADKFAKISGYSGGNKENEDWLVSGQIDLTGQTKIYLNFRETAKFVNSLWDQLTVQISTDFNGTDVAAATWTQVTGYNYPTGTDYTFVESGKIDISAYAGKKIYIAFKYISTTTNAATWEVDRVEILKPGTKPPFVGKTPLTYKAFYQYSSSGWSLMNDVYYVNASDYDAMGAPGSHDNFSSSILPDNYLPALLKDKYPLAGQDAEVIVVYNYYTGTVGTVTLADRYKFNNGAWESTYSYIESRASQFIFSQGKWVFDPTVTFVMKASDYQIIVDWVKTNKGASLVDSYGTQEFYTGAGSYYSNFDLRSGKWDSSTFTKWQDAVTYAIGNALLPTKYPNAVTQVSGIDVCYIVTFATYSAPTGTFKIKFKCTKSGPNPEFTLVDGPAAI